MHLVAYGDWRLSQALLIHGTILAYILGLAFFLRSLFSGEPIVPPPSILQLPPPELILLAREIGVGLATASVGVLYLVGRRLVGTRAALLAAAAFALSPLHVLESHRVNPDQLMILFGLVAAHQALIARDRSSKGRLWVAFALAGLSGATKYTGLGSVGVPGWVAMRWDRASWRRRLALLALGGVVTAATFAGGMIPAVLDPQRFLAALRMFALAVEVGMPGTDLTGQSWTNVRYVYTTLVLLPYMMGWPVYLAGAAGVVLLARRDRRALGVLLAGALPFFIVQGGASIQVPRYLEALVPYVALTAGVALDQLWAVRRNAGMFVAAMVLGYTTALTGSHLARLGLGPQRQVAALVADIARPVNAAGKPLVIGYQDSFVFLYETVRPLLSDVQTQVIFFPAIYRNVRAEPHQAPDQAAWREHDRQWIASSGVEVIIVPEWFELSVLRERPDGYTATFLQRLADGSLGFRLAAEYKTHYLTEALYVWGEPMLRTHWETATSGYKVFVRDRVPGDGGAAQSATVTD